MTGSALIIEEKKPQDESGYESDKSSYLSDGGTSYGRGKLLGVGAFCRAYEIVSKDGQKKKVVLMPVSSGLIRLSKDPLSYDPRDLSKLLNRKNAYILFNNKLYFCEKNCKPIELTYTNYEEINNLFPPTDELIWGSKKRLQSLQSKIIFKPGSEHKLKTIDWDEIQTKYNFNCSMYPEDGVKLYVLDNDYRMITKLIPGVTYNKVNIHKELEHIELFISAIEALEKCHNVCSLLRISRPITMPADELKDLLDNKQGFVLCTLPTHTEIYYVGKDLNPIPLLTHNIFGVAELFTQLDGRKDATEYDLNQLHILTGFYIPPGLVYTDLKTDNIFCTLDYESNLVDGGHHTPAGSYITRYVCKTQAEVDALRKRCYHIDPAIISTVPVIADYSADIYSLGQLLEDVMPHPIPPVADLIARCKKITPKERPTTTELKEILIPLETIYLARHDLTYFPVDFSLFSTESAVTVYRDRLLKQIQDIAVNMEVTNALTELNHDLDSSEIRVIFSKKSMEIIQKAEARKGELMQAQMKLFKPVSGDPHQVNLASLTM